MREIVLDTETTGLSYANGDRLVEIGCVETENMIPTGNTFHVYLNPERDVPEEAREVHGLSTEFLKDKPLFKEKADEFLTFIGDAPLVIHNATFDMSFLNGELQALGKTPLPNEVVDTLVLSRRVNSERSVHNLDSLCKLYKIDTTSRQKHGALIDSELLAKVYLHLKGGPNYSLSLEEPPAKKTPALRKGLGFGMRRKPARKPQPQPSSEEVSTSAIPEIPEFEMSPLKKDRIFKPSETEIGENEAFKAKYGLS